MGKKGMEIVFIFSCSVAKVTDGENKDSYTEDKVVLSFHGKRFFCLTQGGVRQATCPVTHQK
jgi:hypothetical protein